MENKNKYISPEVMEISLDTEISIMLQSTNSTPPELDNEHAYNMQIETDPYKANIG